MRTDGPVRHGPPPVAVAAAALLVAGFAISSVVVPADAQDRLVSNLAQIVAPMLAAASLGARAGRAAGRRRASWAVLALGCVCWAAGQLWWTVEELGGRSTPFPSVGDVGFAAFSLLAVVGLLLHPAHDGVRDGWRRTSDAVMTTAAVVLLSWVVVLGPVVERGTMASSLEWALLLAYPAFDVVLVVLSVLLVARAGEQRLTLLLVGTGVVALSVSDSAFAYLQATSAYAGASVDVGWVAGFLLLALAGCIREPGGAAPGPPVAGAPGGLRAGLLPYLPVAVALLATVVHVLAGGTLSPPEVCLATVVTGLLLARQYLALRDNVRLAGELATREALLRHQAFHDALTGLANRALFLDRLEHALALHRRDRRPVAVVFLDLDDFKVVNDRLGHLAGDELLVRVAERLIGAMRDGDTVARLGGDEFAVLLEDGGDTSTAAARVLEALREPFPVAGRSLPVRASVGVCTLAPDDAPVPADTLLVRSDTAMYAAKRSGKGRAVAYRPGLSLEEVEFEGMAGQLRRALDTGELTLAYQPIVELDTGRVVALEALARWSPGGREVAPDVFVPVAERAGLLDELTWQLLAQACANVAAWSVGRATPLSVHVNVAPASLARPGVVDRVRELVDWHGLASGQLVLELTESGLLAHEEAAERAVRDLADLGVGVSLDDFGVGQSSLARLGALVLESVKIDRSFLTRIDSDEREAVLLGAVVRLARDLALPVIAEGVERPEQLSVLRRMGCPRVQGFLVSRPLPPAAVPDVLDDRAVHAG